MMISDLADHPSWLPVLARWHYDQWGPLTGADRLDGYVALLTKTASSKAIPSVLVAISEGDLLGSASLVASDLPLCPELTPWLAQLFVEPTRRRAGVGAALVSAIVERARQCGHSRVYLYTSGTLPEYYGRLGWQLVERLAYMERERTVMVHGV
jgi:GNAT superfamily N-acetyltransferase